MIHHIVRWLFCAILLLAVLCCNAQLDTIPERHAEIELITIQSPLYTSDNSSTLLSDANEAVQLLGDHIYNNSTSYIRSAGLGSLATLSLWGGSTNQNLIKWEDVPITNPMLGLSDLSLLTLNNNATLTISKGGNSTLHGSGAITGVLELKEKDVMGPPHYELYGSLQLGAFGSTDYNLEASSVGEKWRHKARLFYKAAENNFGYFLNNQQQEQTNADFKLAGIQASTAYKLNDKNNIKLQIWMQESATGIPPTTTQNTSVARQEDNSKRYRLSWNKLGDNFQVRSTLAYLDEHNDYSDSLTLTKANNRFQRWFHKSSGTYIANNTVFNLAYEYSHITAYAEAYNDQRQNLGTMALYGQVKQSIKQWQLDIGLRQEWREIGGAPSVGDIKLSYNHPSYTISTKLSREFRAPTLNELFWRPGGNLDLQPESGWNQELSLQTKPKNLWPNLAITLYHRKIKNWILWAPLNGQFFWSAINLGEVRSYGTDINLTKKLAFGSFHQQWTSGIGYSISENLVALTIPRIEAGDQLLYTPKVNAFLNLRTLLNEHFLDINVRHTGASNGINEDLTAFTTVDVQLGINLVLGNTRHQGTIGIKNLLDVEYRVIERRPMPGRYYSFGWAININNLDNKQ